MHPLFLGWGLPVVFICNFTKMLKPMENKMRFYKGLTLPDLGTWDWSFSWLLKISLRSQRLMISCMWRFCFLKMSQTGCTCSLAVCFQRHMVFGKPFTSSKKLRYWDWLAGYLIKCPTTWRANLKCCAMEMPHYCFPHI